MMQFVLQIYTGTFFARATDATVERTLAKLEQTLSSLAVHSIIVGWNTDAALYGEILHCAHRHGKKVLLWLPVFSEAPVSLAPAPQIGFSGVPWTISPSSAGLEEDFTFICPSSPENRSLPLRLYEQYFSGFENDGVFLDKIRQSSFAGGLERGIGCLCDRCRARYARFGVDLPAMLRRIQTDPARLLPIAREGVRYRFDDADVDRYLCAKAECITEGVTEIASAFRGQGLTVGLDVFAPLLAWYVGQDIRALSTAAEFVKPMFYLRTTAPAGIPFELEAMRDCLGGVSPQPALHALWGAAAEDAAGCVRAQMAELAGNVRLTLPGYEINRVPDVCDSDPDYVRAMALLYANSGAERHVLAWNLLGDTGENLAALSNGPAG